MSKTVCYSGPLTDRRALGSPHYSYRFAEEKFIRCFAAMGIRAHRLTLPEYYGSARARADLPLFEGRLIHFIFRSTEQVRVLKGAYNILCFAWEFPHLKDTNADGEHPFSNQKRMLSLCDEIWVPCTFTETVLKRHGISNVHRIPAAIERDSSKKLEKSEALRRIGHVDCKAFEINFLGQFGTPGDSYLPLFHALRGHERSGRRTIYLSIFNPEDFRKNFDAMVRGFDAFQQANPSAVLVIKALTSAERFSLDRVVLDVMAKKLTSGSSFSNANILVLNHFLDDKEMAALYDLADFYLCTSIAEGQNLPLLEAMARGLVPVTTRNTAMLDYIEPDNSVEIETRTVRNDNPHLAGNVAGKPYDVDLCDARQVRCALEATTRIDDATYTRMSEAASAMVARRYSSDALQPAIAARLFRRTPTTEASNTGTPASIAAARPLRFDEKIRVALSRPLVPGGVGRE